ncbi:MULTISPECIES: primosomal protein [unclassified Mycolicibacterium]|uniref:protein export chaperone SatS n=1 Tax=unclassified Mycolicibacterium TaxID=2636767 RepID=UPI0012DDBC0A|nr:MULTISPECIES: primosomal protein [unclassified Mycolicibacterium]MUL81128.1 primosomal protein [Mycolicibacterium sp. CBMA 329]MUL86894.1 primosomal protein [Mycolicibacterium sp. CBMA 331]MUL98822.1 primosomal protein [Mycolicibacterium sp. CBMA 334]MUM29105.1 primosomal protein [Mycolicibacterium sp. CBMA 295]MUM37191.1 primosomal protein [Mycolicibacterium sp. CBMA 247]
MAADIVPVRLGLTKGDLHTLWAPRWRDAGDEWEAFLGEGDALFAFESVADLAAFVRTNTDNDLADHPAWDKLAAANAHKLQPSEDREYDIVGVPDLVAEKPTEESVATLQRTLVVVSSIGSVCELAAISKFFNGNPVLSTLGGGVEGFTGRAGRKHWAEIETVIARGWDGVLDAIDEIVTIPEATEETAAAIALAEAELDEPAPEEDEDDLAADDEADDSDDDGDDTAAAAEPARSVADTAVLGGDEDFWQKVGIDPVRIMTGSGTVYTLRCYLDDDPVFLGRNGRISVFSSERALARYLADEHDHDLSDLATYDDIRTAATDGSLRVDVAEENIYVLSGISDDIADGPDAVDHDQLELAVELLRDVSDYSEDKTVDETLAETKALGKFVAYVLGSDDARKPEAPYAQAVEQWEALERFVESRLRAE